MLFEPSSAVGSGHQTVEPTNRSDIQTGLTGIRDLTLDQVSLAISRMKPSRGMKKQTQVLRLLPSRASGPSTGSVHTAGKLQAMEYLHFIPQVFVQLVDVSEGAMAHRSIDHRFTYPTQS